MCIFRLLLWLGLAATGYGIRLPLCRSNGQGGNSADSEVCICSTGSTTIVNNLDPQHHGLERLVIFVYKKQISGEIIIFTPERDHQRRIPDFPEDYGTVQDHPNNLSIAEIFENSPSRDIRDTSRPAPYTPGENSEDVVFEKPEGNQQKPLYNDIQVPDWQIPVTDASRPNYYTPNTNNYYTPETNNYQTPGTNDFQSHETYNYPNEGTNDYQTPGTNGFRKPETYNYPNEGTIDYLTPGTNGFQRPETYNYPNEGTNDYQTPGTNGYQRPETYNYPNEGTNDYQTPGSNDFQRPETYNYPNPITNGFQRPEAYNYLNPGTNDYLTPRTNGSQRPEVYNYPNPGTNVYQTPGTNGFQRPETYNYPNDGTNDYQKLGTNVYQISETYNYPNPETTPGTNGFYRAETYNYLNTGTNYYQTPGTNGYQTPGTNGFQRPETYNYPNEGTNDYQTPGTNGFQRPETYNYPNSGINDYQTPGANGFQRPETYNYPPSGTNDYQTPGTNYQTLGNHDEPGSTEYASPEMNNQSEYQITKESIEFIPNDGSSKYKPKLPSAEASPSYVTPGKENAEPNPEDEDAASEKPLVINNEYNNPSDSANSMTVSVLLNSEENNYLEPVESSDNRPVDMQQNPSELSSIHARPERRPGKNPQESLEQQSAEENQDGDIPSKRAKAIRVPLKNKHGRIIGWKTLTNNNYWKKGRHVTGFIGYDHDVRGRARVTSFDHWLKQQLKVTTLSGSRIPTSTRDIIELHSAVQNVLLQNGFVVTKRGILTDGYGKTTSLNNLKLRPIFIGKSFSYDSFIKQSSTNEIPTDSPYLQGLLLSMIKPPKILGIVPLKITSLPNKFGPKNHVVGPKSLLKVLPIEHLVSFRKDSNGASGSEKLPSKPKSNMGQKNYKSKDSAHLKQSLDNISKPGKIGQEVGKPGTVSEEQPDFRIIGGISATVSGTPLLFKGRSGRD